MQVAQNAPDNRARHDNPEDIQPWYRQFWPWFIIALPASVVIAGFTTLWIAIENRDGTIIDSYQEDGMALIEVTAKQKQATALGLHARVSFPDRDSSDQPLTATLALSHAPDRSVTINHFRLVHPVNPRRDIVLEPIDRSLNPKASVGSNEFVATNQTTLEASGWWYISLEGNGSARPDEEESRPWRLRKKCFIEQGKTTTCAIAPPASSVN